MKQNTFNTLISLMENIIDAIDEVNEKVDNNVEDWNQSAIESPLSLQCAKDDLSILQSLYH